MPASPKTTSTPVAPLGATDDSTSLRKDLDAALAEIKALKAVATAEPAEAEPEATGRYLVLSAGICHRVGSSTGHIDLARAGQVVQLIDSEGMRLLMLGAIRAATDEDIIAGEARDLRDRQAAAAQIMGPATNPYGGNIAGGTTLEAHAAEQIAIARKSGALPAAV